MRKRLAKIGSTIFSIFIILALLGGGIIFVIFIIALIVGGSIGNSLALMARETVMPSFIKCATIAMAGGLLKLYASNKHILTMDSKHQ